MPTRVFGPGWQMSLATAAKSAQVNVKLSSNPLSVRTEILSESETSDDQAEPEDTGVYHD